MEILHKIIKTSNTILDDNSVHDSPVDINKYDSDTCTKDNSTDLTNGDVTYNNKKSSEANIK